MLSPMNRGGFGLIDHYKIVSAINAKQLLAMDNQVYNHPIKLLIGPCRSYLNRLKTNYMDDIGKIGAVKVNEMLQTVLGNTPREILKGDRILIAQIKSEKIRDMVLTENSTMVAILQQQGITYGLQISNPELNNLARILPRGTQKLLMAKIEGENEGIVYSARMLELREHMLKLPNKKLKYKNAWRYSSKEIRQCCETDLEIIPPKIITNATNEDLSAFLTSLMRVKNTRQKNIALRVYHGDIFTKEKLFRLGLSDSPNCPKCGQIETREHLLFSCPTTKPVWDRLTTLHSNKPQAEIKDILFSKGKTAYLKIRLELIGLLLQIDRLTLNPAEAIKAVCNRLITCEHNSEKEQQVYRTFKGILERPE
jgi:hypothetical protein